MNTTESDSQQRSSDTCRYQVSVEMPSPDDYLYDAATALFTVARSRTTSRRSIKYVVDCNTCTVKHHRRDESGRSHDYATRTISTARLEIAACTAGRPRHRYAPLIRSVAPQPGGSPRNALSCRPAVLSSTASDTQEPGLTEAYFMSGLPRAAPARPPLGLSEFERGFNTGDRDVPEACRACWGTPRLRRRCGRPLRAGRSRRTALDLHPCELQEIAEALAMMTRERRPRAPNATRSSSPRYPRPVQDSTTRYRIGPPVRPNNPGDVGRGPVGRDRVAILNPTRFRLVGLSARLLSVRKIQCSGATGRSRCRLEPRRFVAHRIVVADRRDSSVADQRDYLHNGRTRACRQGRLGVACQRGSATTCCCRCPGCCPTASYPDARSRTM